MKALRALAFLILALPLLGGEGRTGEGGVWILPNSIPVSSGWQNILSTVTNARAHRQFNEISQDIEMRLPDDMGSALGTLHVPATGQMYRVSIQGRNATLSAELLGEIMQSGIGRAEVLFLDPEGNGLPLLLHFNATEQTLDVYVF